MEIIAYPSIVEEWQQFQSNLVDHLPRYIKQLDLRFFRTAWRQSAKRPVNSSSSTGHRCAQWTRNYGTATTAIVSSSYSSLPSSYRIPSHGWWNSLTLTRQLGKCASYERKAELSLYLHLPPPLSLSLYWISVIERFVRLPLPGFY